MADEREEQMESLQRDTTTIKVEDEPPPKYGMIHKIKQAKTDSNTKGEMVCAIYAALTQTFCYLIILGITMVLPIVMIIIGAMYLDNCPIQRYIPIYLIVSGVVGVVKLLSSTTQTVRQRKKHSDDPQQPGKASNCVDSLLGCFLFIWFICGSVWVFGTHPHFDVPPTINGTGNPLYCNPVCYQFAFAILIFKYALIGLALLAVCCGCCLLCCIGASSKDNSKA